MKTKRTAALVALAALGLGAGCAEIPDAAERPARDAGTPPDAGPDATPGVYVGPCQTFGTGISRGEMPTSVRTAPSGDAVAVRKLFRFGAMGSPEINRIEIFTVGVPGELRGVVSELGSGANADLATCVNCVVAYRQCAVDGYDCALGPFFPRSGRVVTPQVAAGAGAANAVELSAVELVRVEVGADGAVQPVGGDADCVYFEYLRLANTAVAAPAACDEGFHCQLAETAGGRHPD